jgi:hypothetical protein
VAAADAANANQPVAGPSNAGQSADGDENGEDEEQSSPRRRPRTRVSYLPSVFLIEMLITLNRLQVTVQMIWTNPKKTHQRPRNEN